MAHLSPSPSGSSSRRLWEMLGEQQEPFYLDLYLLEKGCSPAFLDTAACSTCWPRARGTSALRRPAAAAASSKKGRGGVLRLLLSKILSGATAPAAAEKQRPAAYIDRRADHADEKQSRPGHPPAIAAVPAASPSDVKCHDQTEVDEEREQDSPVSVLEHRLFDHSPQIATEAFVRFSELLEAAYTPTALVRLLANARQQYGVLNTWSKDGGGSTPTTAPRRRRRRLRKSNKYKIHARARWHSATALVASEMPGARVRAEDVGPEREDVVADVAAAVLDALTEEAAAELMMMMGMGMDDQARAGVCAG